MIFDSRAAPLAARSDRVSMARRSRYLLDPVPRFESLSVNVARLRRMACKLTSVEGTQVLKARQRASTYDLILRLKTKSRFFR